MVQAVCNYLFGLGTAIDGGLGPQTDSHSRNVLAQTGMGGGLLDSRAHWHKFCWAGMRQGHGLSVRPPANPPQ